MRVFGERLNGIQEVKSSILSVSTKNKTVFGLSYFYPIDRIGMCPPSGVCNQGSWYVNTKCEFSLRRNTCMAFS